MVVSDNEEEFTPRNLKLIDGNGEEEPYETNNKNENDNHNNNERDENAEDEAKPVGNVVRVSGRGCAKKDHYASFEFDGQIYALEDTVLVRPEGEQKPFIAIIKDVYRINSDGSLKVAAQWFYRPEDATDEEGSEIWLSSDPRDLFYSFHCDDIPAGSVIHKCVVHFIPLNKQRPCRWKHPGFIVQKVYHFEEERLLDLTSEDYEDDMQEELDVLVNKTKARIGDIEGVETPVSEHHTILSNFKSLTGEDLRDKWLERLLQGIQYLCAANCADGSQEKSASGKTNLIWPDAVLPGVIALEKAAHEELSSDFTKYNQKMRQLEFNLKLNPVLATRLVKGELDASKILRMSPPELKEGLTAEELASKQPEESASVQRTDTRCKICLEKKVDLLQIIASKYQLECKGCGCKWYASRDEVSTLTIETPNAPKNVGTAPLATSKFQYVEKILASPKESNKSTEEIIKKTTEAYMPVLETPMSFRK